jgi:hypothetical protein
VKGSRGQARYQKKTATGRKYNVVHEGYFYKCQPGTLMYTAEYRMYARVQSRGYERKRVNHGRGAFARDEDGDGVYEVHVHTMEGFWSLLRSWLRPHRGISQEKLPLSLGFFKLVHKVRKRGKALLGALIALLVT